MKESNRMNVKMAGMEYALAPLEWREMFAFSAHACAAAMRYIKEKFSLSCVLLSTCNRTELWISYGEGMEEVPSPLELLCQLKQAVPVKVQEFIIEREGEEAVRHLLSLACGMKSKIFGEDQILSQVKSALFLAREQETADTVLEKLFQTAVTARR